MWDFFCVFIIFIKKNIAMKIRIKESQLKRALKEMRFDGKSTGLFSEE